MRGREPALEAAARRGSRDRLQAEPLPLDRTITFLRQAAGAIGAAHERGIVHRDLKPANLFTVADPDDFGGERVKVLDFGIAKLTVDSGAVKTQGVFGTPAYMSPEQCASTGAVDGRAQGEETPRQDCSRGEAAGDHATFARIGFAIAAAMPAPDSSL